MLGYEWNNGAAFCITAVVVAIAAYWWKSEQYYKNYWKKRGVTGVPRPTFFRILKIFLNMDFRKITIENYTKYGKIYGTFERTTPILSCADPEILKDVLVKDFHIFHYRREQTTGDPIADNLVSVLKGEEWKRVRTIITPAFTSKRMREMSSIINECSKTVVDLCEEHFKRREPVECKALFGAFTLDVIARTAFGTKINSLNDPKNVFVKYAKSFFLPLNLFRLLIFLLSPTWLLKSFRFFSEETTNFFKDVTLQVIKERKETGKRYNDVLQILMDAADENAKQENVEIEDETDRFGSIIDKDTHTTSVKYKSLTETELLAQCVLFFVVGYETTASAMACMAHCLAQNPDWQDRVIAEIDEAYQKHGEFSYDSVRELKVLDAVMSETLRMYPALLLTERTADQEYEVGSTGITIEKGTRVSIPIYPMHFDEQYFPEPEMFDPNRFLDTSNETKLSHQYTYLPFGAGPRNCLGMRFALMEIKLVMANILRNFRFINDHHAQMPIEFQKGALLFVKTLPLSVEKRTHT